MNTIITRISNFILTVAFNCLVIIGYSDEISYQGVISTGEGAYTNINGFFKFAIVDSTGLITYWSNDSSSVNGSEPLSYIEVPFPERNGVFQVALGAVPMKPLSYSTFKNNNTYLRIWFSSDAQSFDLLSPDEKISSVAYSLRAEVARDLVNNSIRFEKLSDEFSGMTIVSERSNDLDLISKGFIRFGQISPSPWFDANLNGAPPPLIKHTSIVRKKNNDAVDVLIWGGSPAENIFSNTGWIYNSVSDNWTSMSPVDAPTKRIGHTSVIHENSMLIWGGVGEGGVHLNDGAIYNINNDSWAPLKVNNKIITGRKNHTASIVNDKMIIWGGANEFDVIGDGALYDIKSSNWINLKSPEYFSARMGHSANVYSDTIVIFWGGETGNGVLGGGAVYDAKSGLWAKLVTTNEEPAPRTGHSALVIENNLFIWGGRGNNNTFSDGYKLVIDESSIDFNKNNPTVIGEWIKLNSAGSPMARVGHTVNWNGTEMIIFGGETNQGITSTGYAYDVFKDSWRSLTTKGGVIPRTNHTSAWTGTHLFIFGGLSNQTLTGAGRKIRISDSQLLDTQKTWHLYRKL